jgi:hypothetical protein
MEGSWSLSHVPRWMTAKGKRATTVSRASLRALTFFQRRSMLWQMQLLCVSISLRTSIPRLMTSSNIISFVINKPSALFSAPPKTLDQLKLCAEQHLMAALPVDQSRQWLLVSHL